MANQVTTIPQYHDKLPTFLRLPDLFGASQDALVGGISSGQPPSIGIAGSKWQLLEADGEKLFVQQMYLDVVVVGANEHVSKTYYTTDYDPNNPGRPDCFSDNGVAPSSQSSAPQSPTCATCKWNAFGSKISATGASTKACGDSKKLAVVLAATTPCTVGGALEQVEPFQQTYLLRVPAMSMRPWKEYAADIVKRRWPLTGGVVVRMGFDPEVNYPKIIFASLALIDSQATFDKFKDKMFVAGAAAFASDETKELVGATDVPFNSGGSTPSTPTPDVLGSAPPAAASPATQTSPSSPQPSAPSSQATATQPAGGAPTASPSETGRRRGRPPANPAPVQQAAAQQAPADVFAATPRNTSTPQQNGAIQTPAVSSPDLDALLDSVMG